MNPNKSCYQLKPPVLIWRTCTGAWFPTKIRNLQVCKVASLESTEGYRVPGMESSPSVPFENVGLQRWEKIRSEWVRPRAGAAPRPEIKNKAVDIEDIIERLFAQTGSGVLPEPMSLGQMVDILIDFWEASDD